MAGIYLCVHCGDRFKSEVKLCKNCNTAEKREAMDDENRKIRAEHGQIFHCQYCESRKRVTSEK